MLCKGVPLAAEIVQWCKTIDVLNKGPIEDEMYHCKKYDDVGVITRYHGFLRSASSRNPAKH